MTIPLDTQERAGRLLLPSLLTTDDNHIWLIYFSYMDRTLAHQLRWLYRKRDWIEPAELGKVSIIVCCLCC